jgi:LPS sulfotransferase NodH
MNSLRALQRSYTDLRLIRSFEPRLVWIFGSPRSGSTWLLRLLVHPLVPGEGWTEAEGDVGRRGTAGAGHAVAIPINEPHIPQHLTPPLFQDSSEAGDLVTMTINEFRRSEPEYLFSDRYAARWRPRVRALVLASLYAHAERLCRSFSLRAPLVIVKEPNGSLGADFVMSLHPRARLLFLLRDGRDVVDSMVDAQQVGGWLERSRANRADDPGSQRAELVRRESLLWVARTHAVQRAYQAHPAKLRLLVRYEELLADPSDALARIDHWLDVGRSDASRDEAIRCNDFLARPKEERGPRKWYRAASPGQWRENLSHEEQRVMEEVMGETLVEFGYE